MGRFRDELATNIKAARKSAMLAQYELADMVSLSAASICAYEKATRTPSVETVAMISTACGVPVGTIIPKAELGARVYEGQTSIYDYLEDKR